MGWRVQLPKTPSGRQWQGAQSTRAPLNWASQGQRWGRCKVRRRAELVSRPAIEKKRRRRVLVVPTCSPRPMRAVQRARLYAITWTASQAPLAAKRPGGRWLSPPPCRDTPSIGGFELRPEAVEHRFALGTVRGQNVLANCVGRNESVTLIGEAGGNAD